MLYLLLALNVLILLVVIPQTQAWKRLKDVQTRLHRYSHPDEANPSGGEGQADADGTASDGVLPVTQAEANECLVKALRQLNIEEGPVTENGYILRRIRYQTLEFSVAIFENEESGIIVMLSEFYTGILDRLDEVRTTCNELNTRIGRAKAAYVIDGENNSIHVSMSCDIERTRRVEVMTEHLKSALGQCIAAARLLAKLMDDIEGEKADNEVVDLEFRRACEQRSEALLYETELYHDISRISRRPDGYQSGGMISLGDFLQVHRILPANARFFKLEIDNGVSHKVIEDEDEILAYRLHNVLISSIYDLSTFKAAEGTMKVFYRLEGQESTYKDYRTIFLTFEKGMETDETVYYKVGYLSSLPSPAHSQGTSGTEDAHRATSGSVMLGYDMGQEHKMRAEFYYMWHEANDKAHDGDKKDWTPEQHLIHHIDNPEVAFNLYWGHRYLRSERYYEAALLLQRVHTALSRTFSTLNRNGRNNLDYVSYLLGICYLKLDQPRVAYYYVQHLEGNISSLFTRVVVNSLVAAHDFRAKSYIESAIQSIKERKKEYENDEENFPEELTDVYEFLCRREVFLAVEEGRFDDAERSCRQMLHSSANADFALSELRYINELREADKTLPGF